MSNKWIRIFQISETKPHPAGHTIYRVTCSTFPVEQPHQATTISTWKRYSQFQTLHKQLSTVHKQLYLHGVFPVLPVTGYFNRKDPEVIEQRKDWCLQFLEFVATQPILNTHNNFTNFLFDIDGGDLSSESGSVDKLPLGGPLARHNSVSSLPSGVVVAGVTKSSTVPDLASSSAAGLEVVISSDISIDTTPTLTPSVETPESPAMASGVDNPDSVTDVQESVDNLCKLVAEMPESDIPEYISEAAELISAALRFEAEEQFEASLSSYRSAIGKLLSCVQSDPDLGRQAQVKRRIAQYISKAEQIVKREAELKTKKSSKRSVGIPHLQLFGQLSELNQYKVRNILANKIILAENVHSKQLVIFKTLHKSPAVYKKSKTSLLPINIIYMVRLIKYFETDDSVYLMLEYCSSGTMWDIVQPLVKQREVVSVTVVSEDAEPFERNNTPVQRQTSIIKPSPSFIRDRKKSINAYSDLNTQVCDVDLSDESNDDFDDISVVQANADSVVVVNNDSIQHFEGYDEAEAEGLNFKAKKKNILVQNSQAMLDHISKTLNQNDVGTKSVLDKLDDIENKIKQHLQGDISPDELGEEVIESPAEPQESVISVPLSDNTLASTHDVPPTQTPRPTPPARPAVLRKLSEILPQCPDTDLLDSTELPDRLIRTWAAEIAQVLSSLHYREVIIKDMNPTNILLDSTGHVKLTYQCEWVSVDSVISLGAVSGNYCAPEVVSVGDITPAADWWSYGAILHLLYCGSSPSSVIATGVDSTIPLHFPPGLPEEVQDFIQQLLQVQPVNRLGAGSCGSNDVRLHPYFSGWDWDKMGWK